MSKTKPAFSLIELLIAIVLLGLMAALVLSRIPRLFRYTPAGCGASTCATFSLCMGLEKLPVPAPADISVVCGWPTANQGCGGSGYPCYEQVTNP